MAFVLFLLNTLDCCRESEGSSVNISRQMALILYIEGIYDFFNEEMKVVTRG